MGRDSVVSRPATVSTISPVKLASKPLGSVSLVIFVVACLAIVVKQKQQTGDADGG